MSLDWCTKCREWHWNNAKCYPVWQVRCVDWGEDWADVHAIGAEEAAERFAEDHDEESDLLNNEVEVEVKREDKLRKFNVSAEAVVRYYSNEVEVKDD